MLAKKVSKIGIVFDKMEIKEEFLTEIKTKITDFQFKNSGKLCFKLLKKKGKLPIKNFDLIYI